MTLEQIIIDWLPYWITLGIVSIVLIAWYKIRTSYKITQAKEEGKINKKEESFEGSVLKMLKDSPSQLKQIDSEIATIEEKARRENLTPEATKNLLSRLNSERDMLSYAVKYGGFIKPFVKPADKIINNILGKFTKG